MALGAVTAAAWASEPAARAGDSFGRKLTCRRPVGSLLRLLIQAGYDLDVQDHDGWTPLHAAAHWGVKEACSVLAEALCDMDVRNKLVRGPECPGGVWGR